jgi:hypothetical protein
LIAKLLIAKLKNQVSMKLAPYLDDRAEPRRRMLLLALAGVFAGASSWTHGRGKPSVQVWKDPNCGCCKDWVEHLQQNGFETIVFDEGNTSARSRLGMPRQFGSCHTALVQGYVIEGHVPAADIQRLLSDKPTALGLAVPGMPIGSPGMDGAVYGGRRDPYDVLLIQRNGAHSIFNAYR